MADRNIRQAEPGDAVEVRDLVRTSYSKYVELELTRTLHGPRVTHLHYLIDR